MDLSSIKARLLAAKTTSQSKHYKVAISELVGVLVDLIDELEKVKDVKRGGSIVCNKPPTIPERQKPFDGIESPPAKRWVKDLDPEK